MQSYNDLLSKLEDYCNEDYVPMHMPGAKRNTDLFKMENPYGIDITEIDGFDNLHHATDIIADSMENAAKLFGADETLYLVNGSSAGILSAICGATNRNDKILIARNCHCSVYNALYINGLRPVYFIPEYDNYIGIYKGVTLDLIIENVNKSPDIKAVVITSPTYEGYVSDIKNIADYLHKNNIILIVDEAHGAHFNFSDLFPESAVKCGADAVIQSIHKTLPAFTQTALLHLNGPLINRRSVKRYWNIYQSTSPSYVLMAGIDRCMSIISCHGNKLFTEYIDKLTELRNRINKLEHIRLLETDDISKLVLVADNGKKLYETLINGYHIQLEMSSLRYVIAMTSIGDKENYYNRFAEALEEIDMESVSCKLNEGILYKDKLYKSLLEESKLQESKLQKSVLEEGKLQDSELNKSVLVQQQAAKYSSNRDIEIVMTPYEANSSQDEGRELWKLVRLEDAQGLVSGSMVCMYPPGIPLVNSGERVTEEIIDILIKGIESGLEVIGLEEGKILCLK